MHVRLVSRLLYVLVALVLVIEAAPEARGGNSNCFIRGDCDLDGNLSVTDMIISISYILLNGITPPCLDSCDTDDSGWLAINDGIFVLTYLFNSGPTPDPPFPTLGTDPTPDGLGCLNGLNCSGPPPPPPPPPSGTGSTLSQHGITWTFNDDYDFGQFVNGDYWVVGPVTIIYIDPPSYTVGGRVRNGSMVNVTPGLDHGWDSTLYGDQAEDHYKPDLNVAYQVSTSNPLVLAPGSSLISSISVTAAGALPGLQTATVLTVLNQPPPAGSFRPPYAGSQKQLYNFADVQTHLLANLPVISGTPNPAVVAANFERVWLEHKNTHMCKYHHPVDNMPWYGRDMAEVLGTAALLLQTNVSMAEKQLLLIRFLQIGIDLDRLGIIGMSWAGNGGHMNGRKFPVLFKRVMFGEDVTSLGSDPTEFSEDDQTFFVEETSAGVYNYGYPRTNNPGNDPDQCVGIHPYGPGQLGMPEWSHKHWAEVPIGSRDAGHTWSDGPALPCKSNNHRFCCTYAALGGHFLAAYAMNLRSAWNWEPAFEYMDRYIQITPRQWRQRDEWTEAMWDTYRPIFGGYDSVPASWIPSDL